ncbi:hypothetical protein CC86DRAFT_371522 [Ophiobolus disseminans]|uniref:C2H2-type domain-containing protein n=1 Tax=Ophiobolus disseminans TaxID=1469910 RepID=A0A6A6ZUV8_9PLEO|nr:hypothetical protein CC86DRAFT_371522 [Ophiobolus disseminans]
MDEQLRANEWQFGIDTQDDTQLIYGFDGNPQAFDGPWGNIDDVDFLSSTQGVSTPLPGVPNYFNDLGSFDNLAIDNLSPAEPLSVPDQEDVFDFSTLQTVVQQDRTAAPRQHTLPRRRSKYILRRGGSNTSPIPISNLQHGSPHQPVAIQRWQNSPPEDEAASLSAIYNAMEQRPLGGTGSGTHTPNLDHYRTHRGPSSTTSLESGLSESSVHSANSKGSSKSQRRRRPAKPRTAAKGKAKPKDAANRIFKCTFCCDTFVHKYDWSRHEKSLHLNMEEWVCTPHGGSVVLPTTGRVHCAYCSALDPAPQHLESHNYSACQGGQPTPRTFRRKDHLVQHLRLAHGLDTLPLIDDWKVASAPVTSRCGFCDANLSNWDERTDHLAAHFRSGKTMSDWRGNHGFDAIVNARVTNDFPPWLIAAQADTLVPFSATSHGSRDHSLQFISTMEKEQRELIASLPPASSQTTATALPTFDENMPTEESTGARLFADVLSKHLAQFARQQMMMGVVPTDEMFQRESRRVLYQDADDEWNQTVADNPEWIQEFRARTGFNMHEGV